MNTNTDFKDLIKADFKRLVTKAVDHGQIDELLALIGKEPKAGGDARYWRSALGHAMRHAAVLGNRPMVEVFLDTKIDIHFASDDTICAAAANGHTEIVEMLLDRGADIHAKHDHPLRWACRNGKKETVALLLRRGADPKAMDNQAVRWAVETGNRDIAKLIISHYKSTDLQELLSYGRRKQVRQPGILTGVPTNLSLLVREELKKRAIEAIKATRKSREGNPLEI
jgi:hypothetical protein